MASVTADKSVDIENLTRHCRKYKGAVTKRAVTQLVSTAGLFLILSGIMTWGVMAEFYWPLVLLLPAGGLLVRLFIIQHDCGHRSFFHSGLANDLTGRVLSLFTLMPYGFWRQAHNIHHAGSGNLDRRGVGSIDTLTVAEYRALPMMKKLSYRLYRHPVVLLVFGMPLDVIVFERFPYSQELPFLDKYQGLPVSRAWKSVLGLDLALICAYGLMGMMLGWSVVFLVFLPAVIIASWIGGWLFFIQHQFEEAYWEGMDHWDFHEASVLGSSYYVLPPVLQWFTGNIGLHHIHHLCPAIPNYRLQECLNDSTTLQSMNRLTLAESLKCLRWALWDESSRKMVGFRHLRAAPASA